MMILLCSVELAKQHLRILHNDSDADIEHKLAVASEMLLRYRKLDAVPAEWFTGDPPQMAAPYREQGVTLGILGMLFEGREADTIDVEAIDRLLSLVERVPTLA